MMSLQTAIKCFDENRDLFDARSEPEKFNLYTGLASFAEALGETQIQLEQLRIEVANLRNQLAQIRR